MIKYVTKFECKLKEILRKLQEELKSERSERNRGVLLVPCTMALVESLLHLLVDASGTQTHISRRLENGLDLFLLLS